MKFIEERFSLLTFLGPMILGNVNVEHPSATIPNFVNGVQKNDCNKRCKKLITLMSKRR